MGAGLNPERISDQPEEPVASRIVFLAQVQARSGAEAAMFPVPAAVFLTRGVGVHRHQLTAFEYALREADIEQQNLVSVSSILSPGCELIPAEVGIATLRPGEITFCVMARAETSEPGRRIAASIGIARPKDPMAYGYISE